MKRLSKNRPTLPGVSGVPGRAHETDPIVVRFRQIDREIAGLARAQAARQAIKEGQE